ncbi:MAG: hypothetical protein ACFWUM_08520 [Eubacteriales bacterium]|jgi:[ribosomal protein S5]-alanine N-acetyltransferase
MKNRGTREIRTERLILRPFTLDDAEDMYQYAKDPEVTKYARWKPHESIQDSLNLLEEWIKSYSNPGYYSWAIARKEDNRMIGCIGITNVSDIDESGEVGYWLGKSWWGRGIMTEALKAVIRFVFEQCEFNRLEACHSVNNPASGCVMQKAGMTFEGIAREKCKSNAGFQDCRVYAILKKDIG